MFRAASSSGGGNESPRGTERTARRARVTSPTKSSSGLASYATSNSRSTVALRVTPPGRHDCTASVAAAMTASCLICRPIAAAKDLEASSFPRAVAVFVHQHPRPEERRKRVAGVEAFGTAVERQRCWRYDDLERVCGRGAKKRALPSDRSARARCVYRAAVAGPRAESAGRRSGANRVPVAMDDTQVAAIAFEEDAVAAWRVREDGRLADGLADIVRKKQRVRPAGKLPLHAGQGRLLHRDGPPRRAAGACVLAPIGRMQAKAVGRSRRWGVFHFENGDYRKEPPDPCAGRKTGAIYEIGTAPVLLIARDLHV